MQACCYTVPIVCLTLPFIVLHVRPTHRYRLVITEMNAMVGLLFLADLVFFCEMPEGSDAHVAPVAHKEAAHITLKIKPRETAEGGKIRLSSYRVGSSNCVAPSAWVLEGLTSDY